MHEDYLYLNCSKLYLIWHGMRLRNLDVKKSVYEQLLVKGSAVSVSYTCAAQSEERHIHHLEIIGHRFVVLFARRSKTRADEVPAATRLSGGEDNS